ncbi:DASS family sodium-coupled anion symporter [Pseudomonas sp. Irchel s3h17]|uniref:DASS family sodium-coupled anion symporter n=1 Tax=Pseudomonas sp. Irchel s3h17 TaxID=2009182 RepID=UPI000BA38648|nr:DASS family sodium-coupled anion symporter [Pseudomonas sp. Irchel s3h17]
MAVSSDKDSTPISSLAPKPSSSLGDLRNAWRFFVPVIIGIALWFLPAPSGLDGKAWHMFAVFVATIAGIMTAPLPMSAVAIIGSTVGVLVGVVSLADVTRSTGTDLVWLVMLAFFISRGVIKTGLGRRIALLFMRLLGKRTLGLGYGLVITELLISPAMPSITARAGGVMLPITRSMAEVLGSHADDPESRGKVGRYLILCAFHANIITAGMFITAMAGNPLVVKLAADQGALISWLDWAVAASVPGLLCLAIIPVAMLWLAKPQIRRTPDATALAQRELIAMGPISVQEKVMAVIFLALLVLWIFGKELDIGATLAAALGVSLLFITGVLTWQDALNEKTAWDTMIWIGLLVMLASKLNEYGMVSWFGEEFGAHLAGFPRLAVYMMVAVIYFYIHYFFASATAHVSALFPLSMALMVAAGIPPFTAAIALGILSSINGSLTQYGIGSGPVMFGSGYVTQKEWWKAGFLMSLIYMVVWLVIGPLWWKVLGYV